MELRLTWIIDSLFFIQNIIITLGFLLKSQSPKIVNPVVTSIFFLAIIGLERFTSFKLKNYIRLLLVITLISHSLFGEYYRAYYTTTYFDNFLHCLGSFTFALLSFELINSFIKVCSPRLNLLIFILVFLAGTGLGAIFESFEFALDVLLNENNQFGLIDTDLDLLYNVIGSFFAGVFAVLKGAHGT